MKRAAGILLPIFSLPSRYGIGCFSKEAYRFIDWLKEAGQSYWQILPLGITSYGDSPYQSFSTFAGNPYFIDLDALAAQGVLTAEECAAAVWSGDPAQIDYAVIYRTRYPLLRKAFERSRVQQQPEYQDFVREQSGWLEDYALFMALKGHFGGTSWLDWEPGARLRESEAMEEYRTLLKDEMAFHRYLQFEFLKQWKALRSYANRQGIQIIGDIPIYVAMDSADAWAHPELFQLDQDNRPVAVAGCPPDGFSATGQLWGNPLYRWQAHRAEGYRWWIRRLEYCFSLYDVLRIDHFRGFDEYYSIPAGAPDAASGHWEKGPGAELFSAAEAALGKRPVIAEDLGYVTDTVRQLVAQTGYPGMKVLEFAFDSRDTGSAADYLPHNYPENCVAYTGTHDNETLTAWFKEITDGEREAVREYLWDWNTPEEKLCHSLIALVMRSRAALCIIPIQDYLGLGASARLNRPSTIGTNWRWRLTEAECSDELLKLIQTMTARFGRLAE